MLGSTNATFADGHAESIPLDTRDFMIRPGENYRKYWFADPNCPIDSSGYPTQSPMTPGMSLRYPGR
jgi:prepilin-type processing-associated H-X9-DG protein